MPHVNIKLYPGRSEDVKKKLAEKIAQDTAEIAGCSMEAVSVAVEEIQQELWADTVYKPEILDKKESLIVKPGYNPFES